MKLHIYFNATIAGDMDLNNFMPTLISRFPDSKVSMETANIGKRCIVIEKPIQNIKLVQINENIDCKIIPSFKLNIYETMGYAYLDICLDIDPQLVTKLIDLDKNLLNAILGDGKIEDEDKEVKEFTSILLPLFLNKLHGKDAASYMENLEVDIDQITTKLKDFKKKYHVKPILVGLSLHFNLNIGACPYALIEDFDNELELDSRWKNISNKENILYENELSFARICKNEKLLESSEVFNYCYHYNQTIITQFLEGAKEWMGGLGNEVENIRENISKDNSNPYYWKELKRRIEILDLNFLEFNSYVIQKTMKLAIADRINLHFKEEYTQKIVDFNRHRKETLFKCLSEIRSAIANLSTPGHTHDEMFLQEETEKVNERILMLSFIAMSIPTIGAVLSPGIPNSIKFGAGAGVFLLPITYLLIRNIIKKVRFNKNRQLESARIVISIEKELKALKQQTEDIKNVEKMPPQFREQVLDLMTGLMNQYEDRLKSLQKNK